MSDCIERARVLLRDDYGSACDKHRTLIADLVAEVDQLNRLGNELADAVPVRAPMVASQPYRNGYQDCIQRMRGAVEAWESR